MRPGEKLYEELLADGTNVDKTCKEKIFVEKFQNHDINGILDDIIKLKQVVNGDIDDIKSALKAIVPTYVENNE